MTDRRREVRATFEAIAEEFAETRQEPWPAVERFVEQLDGGDVALDLGCGNGRHAPVLRDRFDRIVGVDVARRLLARADPRVHRVQGDLLALPLQADAADGALCVAALHHVPGREHRLEALAGIDRVLRPGASCLVSVWALAHSRFDGMRDAIRADDGDVTVPWKGEDATHPRYYHVYERDEFHHDVEAATPAVDDVWSEQGNHYAVLRASGDGDESDGG